MTWQKFGITWWGKEWLNTLKQIDFSNRLPRGARYARNGSVLGFEINDNQITAQVQGTQIHPYQVEIKLKKLSRPEQQKTLALIEQQPLVLAQLLNHQLPAEVNQLLEAAKITLFPQSWRDLTASCSCPDSAVPCKHIAAVIYLVAQEIDTDPFMVFSLRGYPLLAELQKNGYELPTSTQRASSLQLANRTLLKNSVSNSKIDFQELVAQLDFTLLPDMGLKNLQLLAAKPSFSSTIDFRQEVITRYQKIKRKSQQLLEQLQVKTQKRVQSQQLPLVDLKLVLNADLQVTNLPFATQLQHNLTGVEFYYQPLAHLFDWKQSEQLVLLLWRISLQLLAKGLILPEVVGLEGEKFKVRWVPNFGVKEVKDLMESIVPVMNQDLVIFKAHFKSGSKAQKYLPPLEQLQWVVAEFVQFIFAETATRGQTSVLKKIFFSGQVFTADDLVTQGSLSVLQLWLKKLHLSHGEWLPTVIVTSVGETAYELELAVTQVGAGVSQPISLKQFLTDPAYQQLKLVVLQDLLLLDEQLPVVSQLIADLGQKKALFNAVEFEAVLFEMLPKLRLLGIPLVLPKGLEKILRPKVSLSISSKSSAGQKSYFSFGDLLEFDWRVALGQQNLSVSRFTQLLKKSKGIIKWQDQFVYLNENEVSRLWDKLQSSPKLSKFELMRTVITGQYKNSPVDLSTEVQQFLKKMKTMPTLEPPVGLKAQLRPYQLRGLAWLYHNAQLGFGSLLADDMGLGKTIQIISLVLLLEQKGVLNKPILIVVPTAVLVNWQKEFAKFAPEIPVALYHGSERDLTSALEQAEVIITSYSLVRRDLEKLKSIEYQLLVLDEAQNIKNHSTAQAKAVKSLQAQHRIALTGTPVENGLLDYWSIADFLQSGYLMSERAFIKEIARPIEINRDQQQLEYFQRLTQPFILRRLKTDKSIISDLPDKIVTNQFCQLTKEQTLLYQALVEEVMNKLEATDQPKIQRAGLIFKLIVGLKQICNHPHQYHKQPGAQLKDSGKLMRLVELLSEIYENRQQALIFTQFTQMGQILVEILAQEFGVQPLFYHGGLSRDAREKLVVDFQEKRQAPFMILSLKAGGTGLNLTAANHVLHYDLWWNPAVENQATDRVFRIGQQQNVNVHRFITQDTFEEKIDKMIQDKQELANLTVKTGEKWLGELSNQELTEIFRLG